MNNTNRKICGNAKVADRNNYENAKNITLEKLKNEINRQVQLQDEGRFERASSHPSHTNASNYAISMEEYLEVMEAFDKVRASFTERVLAVTKAMQDENKSQEHLENEVLQTASTFIGWLISRERSKNMRNNS